jgi:gliding motility-associated-like protein
MKLIKIFSLLIFSSFCVFRLEASHLRAGEITVKKISTLQYQFTLTLYRDTRGVTQPNATLDFGDGSTATANAVVDNAYTFNAISNTQKLNFTFNHTFPSTGNYKVFFVEKNRNAEIRNMRNSGLTQFYVETLIRIDAFLGANTSPALLNPPVDQGSTNQIFTHSPAAWDADGDSLAYRLSVPKKDVGMEVDGYIDPASPNYGGSSSNGGTPFLRINPLNGLITWDRPAQLGLYNIAFIIEEWRSGVLIGSIERDMQINIIDIQNKNPTLIIPKDTCITAGLNLKTTITGTDFTTVPLELTAYSGIFSLGTNAAKTTLKFNSNPQYSPHYLYFNWNTNCSLVREQPYQVTFKLENYPNDSKSLTSLKVWQIKIKAPQPDGLKSTSSDKNIILNWNKYLSACTTADSIYIMRSDCSAKNFSKDSCIDGSDLGLSGFRIIGKVKADASTFTDTNKGKGLQIGSLYTYVIYATFKAPQKGVSRPSATLVASLDQDVPVISTVSVQTTDSINGKILVRWKKPVNLNSNTYPAPYTYEIYRKSNLESVFKLVGKTNSIADTSFVDTNLNTWYNSHRYVIRFYFGNANAFKSSTDTATAVRLIGVSKERRITLGWLNTTPWRNDTTLIFRIIDKDTVKIDSVINTNSFTDRGNYKNIPLIPNTPYRYLVKTKGNYFCGNTNVKLSLFNKSLVNNSNLVTAYVYTVPSRIDLDNPPITGDTNKPCPPQLQLLGNCNELSETLSWQPTFNFYCDSAVIGYKIYGSKNVNSAYQYLLRTSQTNLQNSSLTNNSSCFYATAHNKLGLESKPSNIVCSDECFFLELPNFFSPNGDGYNDKFTPIKQKYVESIDFKVYSRWGDQVFSRNDNTDIEWDGLEMPVGVYYYSAIVTFAVPNGNKTTRVQNGWIQLSR